MVNDKSERLDRVFSALGNPTRRAILARLARDNALSVSELAEPFEIKLPAVMKHLDVLEGVGLIRRAKAGHTVTVELSPRPLRTAMDWLQRCEHVWEANLDRLTRYAEKRERESQERNAVSEVTLVRRIAARPSIVFDALITVEGIASWFGPDEGPVLAAASDAKVGGRFRIRFRKLDGSEHECSGEFLEIEQLRRIVMSYQWTSGGLSQERGRVSRLELHLRPIDTGTELTLVPAALADESSASEHGWGWGGALDKLMRGLAASRHAPPR